MSGALSLHAAVPVGSCHSCTLRHVGPPPWAALGVVLRSTEAGRRPSKGTEGVGHLLRGLPTRAAPPHQGVAMPAVGAPGEACQLPAEDGLLP